MGYDLKWSLRENTHAPAWMAVRYAVSDTLWDAEITETRIMISGMPPIVSNLSGTLSQLSNAIWRGLINEFPDDS